MENKEEKVVTKTSGGVKALLVILILALIGTSGFIVYDKFIAKDNESKSNTKEETKKEEKKESVKKIDETKEYVYDLKSGENYKVPTINIDSEDAKRMNEEIKVFVDYERVEEKYGLNSNKLEYDYFINNDLISVVVIIVYPANGSKSVKPFNINKNTGREVTNEEILKIKNISFEELKVKIFDTYESIGNNSYLEHDKNTVGHYNEDEYNGLTVYEANKKKFENLNLEKLELFLNENGELLVSVGVYLSAGPTGRTEVYDIDTKSMKYNFD